MSRRVLCAVAVTASACGGTSATPASCRPVAPIGPHQQAGALSVTADRGRVVPGSSITFNVVVTGPVQLVAPCDGAVELIVKDTSADLGVYDGRSAAGRCGPITLAQGERLSWAVPWRSDPTLPAGGYSATILAADQPAVTLPVTVIPTPDPASCV